MRVALRNRSTSADWPELPWEAWSDTATTLHLWTQVIGKIRLVQTPWINHSWHVALYPTARGLTTSPLAFDGDTAELSFDLIDHQLLIQVSDGRERHLSLRDRSVADFYHAVLDNLRQLGLPCDIHSVPSEIAEAIPFEEDHEHHRYDPEYANRFLRVLLQVHRVFTEFRAGFTGKVSPVHFFWGSFDLAVTRFTGRAAPTHPGGVPNFPDWVAAEAYSHEVSSAGFWPGGGGTDFPAFYSYAYPAPDGFANGAVEPADAYWSKELGEYVLPYDSVRNAASPDDCLLDFLETTYALASDKGGWPRAEIERPPGGFEPLR
ncbi:MAG: DUF5996 family protein [Pseudomonadota bacterium]